MGGHLGTEQFCHFILERIPLDIPVALSISLIEKPSFSLNFFIILFLSSFVIVLINCGSFPSNILIIVLLICSSVFLRLLLISNISSG